MVACLTWANTWGFHGRAGSCTFTCCTSLCPCAWHLLISFRLFTVFPLIPEKSAAEGCAFHHSWVQCLEKWLTQKDPRRCLSDQPTMHTVLGKVPEGSTSLGWRTLWCFPDLGCLLEKICYLVNAPLRPQRISASKPCLYHFLFYHLADCLY